MSTAISNTGDTRMQALGLAATGLSAYNTVNSLTDKAGIFDAAKAADITINVSIGFSKSKSNSNSTSNTARGSTVTAGNNVKITATGAGKDSNILIQGSDIKAGNNASLTADNQVNLLAAKNETSQQSTNSSSSASIGFSVGGQTGVTVAASKGKGKSNGADTTYTNTTLTAGNLATIKSGGDTAVKGAVVSANQIKADIGQKYGGNLNIESLQDKSTYSSSQQSAGGSITFGPGGVPTGGSISASKSKINSNFESVNQQSGFKAGDGGFQVSVANNTSLTGGVISSTQTPIDNKQNSFTTGGALTITDVQNTASFKGTAVGGTIGVGSQLGSSGAGVGNSKGSAASTSSAGISGVAGNTAVRTGDKETGLKPIFNADKVQKDIDAQVKITTSFGQQAVKAGAQYAQNQLNKANGLETLARLETDPERKAALQKEADDIRSAWKEGGPSRLLMHAGIGLLGGGVGGAVGAAGSAAITPTLSQWLQDNQASPGVSAIVLMATGAAVGGLTGGMTGAASGFNEVTNNGLGTVIKYVGVPALIKCLQTKACLEIAGPIGIAITAQAASLMQSNPGLSESNAYTIAVTDLSNYGLTGKPGMPLPGTTPPVLPGTAIATNNTTGGNQTVNPVGTSVGGFGAGGKPVIDPLTYATSPIGSTSPVNTSQGAGINVTTGSGSQIVVLPTGLDARGAGHILIGDNPNSGGHLWPGQPGKTPFPQSWTPEKILGEISSVASDPNSTRTPGRFGNDDVIGVRNGVQILVHVSPNGRVVAGYPINLLRNP